MKNEFAIQSIFITIIALKIVSLMSVNISLQDRQVIQYIKMK